jgi:putative ABC transport system ATP-binding protein
MRADRDPIAGELELEDVSLNIGGRWVLERLSLALRPGEITALSGPSGSGKTTLLSIAGGIVKPTTGLASYGGQHMWLGDGDPRHEVAFVLQVYGLVPILSARENVAIALRARGVRPREADERADEELARFHIGDLGDRQVEELSGGQMQRVACARAFAVSPEILLADEPTSELDEGNREHVMDQLRVEAERGAVVVVATHDPAVVESSDRTLVLDAGRLVPADGSAYASGR